MFRFLALFYSLFFSLMSIVIVPLHVINSIGSLVWLISLQEWGILGPSVLISLISPFIISLLLLPAIAIGGFATMFEGRSRVGTWLLMALASLGTIGAITVWCIGILVYYSGALTPRNVIPVLLLTYEVATGPWVWMAVKERQSSGEQYSLDTALVACFALISTVIHGVLVDATILTSAMIFTGILLVHKLLEILLHFVSNRVESVTKVSNAPGLE